MSTRWSPKQVAEARAVEHFMPRGAITGALPCPVCGELPQVVTVPEQRGAVVRCPKEHAVGPLASPPGPAAWGRAIRGWNEGIVWEIDGDGKARLLPVDRIKRPRS